MILRPSLRQSYRDIVRLRHVAEILIKNGLGFLIERLGLTRLLAPRRRRPLTTDQRIASLSIPERVRRTLEELGPTYVKLGQLMSTRPDVFPPEYIAELSKLLDAAPPVSAETVLEQIKAELGKPVEALFAAFDPVPVASASIGQVHHATLPSGERVVVKVQRPAIQQVIESDLGILLRQARFLEAHSITLREYQLVNILEEFGQALQDELDYIREGRNAERLRQVLGKDPRVIIPQVHWELTTRRVITMEAVTGCKLTDLARLQNEGYDLAAIAKMMAEIYFQQVFVAGVFHADPHPANILIHNGQLSLVDFGLVGFLTPKLKETLGELFLALMSQDVQQITDTVLGLGAIRTLDAQEALQKDIQRLLHRYYGLPLESVSLGEFLKEIMGVAFRHRLRLPADLALLARMMIVLEGVTRQLAPDFNFAEAAKPFVSRLMRERVSLRRWGSDALQTVRGFDQLFRTVPHRAGVLLDQLEHGETTIGIDIRRLNRVMLKLDTIANRLAFSVIIAALIIGSSLIIQTGVESSTWYVPLLGWGIPVARIIFVIAGILGGWLLLSIVRSRGL